MPVIDRWRFYCFSISAADLTWCRVRLTSASVEFNAGAAEFIATWAASTSHSAPTGIIARSNATILTVNCQVDEHPCCCRPLLFSLCRQGGERPPIYSMKYECLVKLSITIDLISHQDTEALYHSCNINEIVDYGKKSVRKKKILYYVPTARDLVFYFSFVFRFSRLRISYLLVPGLHLFLTFLFVGFKQIMRD